MPVEIEFEPDEDPGPAWPDTAGAVGAEHLGLHVPTWRAPDPRTLLRTCLVVAVAVLATAGVGGFLVGRSAPAHQHAVALRVADVNSLAIDPVPAVRPRDGLLPPWTGTFDRSVALTLVNAGPDPVTILDGALLAPQITVNAPLPAGEVVAPGARQVLRTHAHFDCVDYALLASSDIVSATETTALLDVRTIDGTVHRVNLLVDAFDLSIERAVCAQVQNPQVLGLATAGAWTSPTSFTATVPVVNRAPFPLRVNLDQQTTTTWVLRAGLILITDEGVVPAGGTSQIVFTVQVTDCLLARTAVEDATMIDTLVFTDERLALNNPMARQFVQPFDAATIGDAIFTACPG